MYLFLWILLQDCCETKIGSIRKNLHGKNYLFLCLRVWFLMLVFCIFVFMYVFTIRFFPFCNLVVPFFFFVGLVLFLDLRNFVFVVWFVYEYSAHCFFFFVCVFMFFVCGAFFCCVYRVRFLFWGRIAFCILFYFGWFLYC